MDSVLSLLIVILLLPLGYYLRVQAYRGLYGNGSIIEDIYSLIQKVKDWRRRRRYQREFKAKYKHLNKRKE